MNSFSHQDSGSVKDVSDRLRAKREELKAGNDTRHQTVVDASLGGVAKVLDKLPNNGQATVTAQVDERFGEGGKHLVTKFYVDVTVVPAAEQTDASTAVAATAAKEAKAPTPPGELAPVGG